MVLADLLTIAFLGLGCFFAVTGAVGLLRMPDFYSRLHPAGKSDTLAQALILIGLCFQTDDPMVVIKLALLSALLFVTAPTATHAISRAARLDGLEPWRKASDRPAAERSSARADEGGAPRG